jgi:hypothetical protein
VSVTEDPNTAWRPFEPCLENVRHVAFDCESFFITGSITVSPAAAQRYKDMKNPTLRPAEPDKAP